MEKVEPIVLTYNEGQYNEKQYVIEFSRETCAQAERAGFSAEKVEEMVMVQVPLLFYWGFKMHHPKMSKAEADKILFEDLGGVSDTLIQRLIELYAAPYEALINETGTPKNANLTVRI